MEELPIHLYSYNNVNYCIDIEDMKVYTVSNDSANKLNKSSSKKHDTKKIPTSTKNNPNLFIPITSIAIFLTQDCNLNCIYCYEKSNDKSNSSYMKKTTALKAIDWLVDNSGNNKKLDISFFGGEPLLQFELMKDILNYARQISNEKNKIFNFNITTNATLLNDEVIDFLKKHKISPLISFDGNKEIQDAQRPFKNGKGTYDIVVPKIKKLLEQIPESECHAVLSGNTKVEEVEEPLKKLGFKKISVAIESPPLNNCKNNNGDIQNGSINSMLKKTEKETLELLSEIKKRDIEKIKRLKETGMLLFSLERFINRKKRFFNCAAGRSLAAISCEGDIYLCHRFVGIKKYKIGNVYKDVLDRKTFLSSHIFTEDSCQNCVAKYHCGGGCYHDNLGRTGSIYKGDSNICQLMQRTTELAAYVITQLNNNDIDFLRNEKIIAKYSCPFDLF